MSSPVLVMCSDPAGLAVLLTLAALVAAWTVGAVCDHRMALDRWRLVAVLWLLAQVRRGRRMARAVPVVLRAAGLWLLVHALRAHGRHRAGVA